MCSPSPITVHTLLCEQLAGVGVREVCDEVKIINIFKGNMSQHKIIVYETENTARKK